MMARGNVSYSVSMTTVATLLSPVVVPIAFALFLGASFEVDPIDTSWKLIWQVVLPVVIGFGLSRLSSMYAAAMGAWGPVLANAAILWIVGLVVAENRAFLVQSPPAVFLALVLLNLLGYAGGYGVGIAAQLDPVNSFPISRRSLSPPPFTPLGVFSVGRSLLGSGRKLRSLPCPTFGEGPEPEEFSQRRFGFHPGRQAIRRSPCR
jgi:hypothetical protein